MDQNKPKDGVSVKEIESFAKKHRFEVFFCIAFVLACFFTFVFFTSWSIFFAALGGVIGVTMPAFVSKIIKTAVSFVLKQEKTTQIVLAVVSWILCIFLPPLMFLLLGLSGGKNLYKAAIDTGSSEPKV
jgi:hypothetical protein